MKYTGKKTREITFPLGGIGTGSVSLGGNGRLMDFEIFNRPFKGSLNGYSHFAIKAIKGGKPIAFVLNGDLEKDLMGQYKCGKFSGYGFGPEQQKMCGFPHFKNLEFDGEFPFATLKFSDEKFPADVTMTAFNPFIPSDSKNSSIPAAFFEFEVKNITDEPIKYQLSFSISNPFGASLNKSSSFGTASAVTFYNADEDFNNLTIASDSENSFTQTYWYRGSWQDNLVTYWNEFSSIEGLKKREYDEIGKWDMGTVASDIEVMPGESKKVRFLFSWYIPYAFNYWNELKDENGQHIKWKNWYASVFESSLDAARYCFDNWNDLYERTMKFKNALFSMTLPEAVIDAAASNLSVLKSPTVLRLEDGSFYGFEGVHEREGSCEGTCQHVWNYAYALCFLFPDLERSIRDLEFKYNTFEDGKMRFRLPLPLGREEDGGRACLDGQMGTVIKCYRDWKISGNSEWLAENWENIKKVLEYAWSEKNFDCWDLNKDGVLEGRQHHTLDMELFGPSSWLEGMYLAALKAAAEMADFMGDTEKAVEYRELFEKGYNWTKENLFNGKYFFQKIDITDKSITDRFNASDRYWNDEAKQIKYQVAGGSSIDQVLAQWHADIIGLGDIFDSKQLDSALKEMMKNNFKPCMRDFANPWRIFSLNDESGSVICDYPEGVEKPRIPIPYCEETMTGFEYSFAGLLCSRNMVDEGITVAKAVRDRFDGEKRNPWNEFECGSNYARSMASFALIPILSGFEFDMPKKHLGFNPYKLDGGFRTFWGIEGAWGTFTVNDKNAALSVVGGKLSLSSLGLKFSENVSAVKIDGNDVDFKFENGILSFSEAEITEAVEIAL